MSANIGTGGKGVRSGREKAEKLIGEVGPESAMAGNQTHTQIKTF